MAASDPRIVRSKEAILRAAHALLKDEGYRGFTIEGVAARSGVAKTTVYRHWPDRHDLLLEVFESVLPPSPAIVTDDLRGDLVRELRRLAAALTASDWVDVLPALIEAAEREPDFRALSRRFVEARRKPVKDRLQRAVRDGLLDADADVELLLAQLAGPLFYRRLLTHQPVTPALVDRLVDQVLRGAPVVAEHQSR